MILLVAGTFDKSGANHGFFLLRPIYSNVVIENQNHSDKMYSDAL